MLSQEAILFVAIVVNIAFSLLALSANRSRASWVYASMNFSVSFWAFSLLVFFSFDTMALIGARMAFFSASVLAIIIMFFVDEIQKELGGVGKYKFVSIPLGAIFLLLSFSPLIVSSVETSDFTSNKMIYGGLYNAFGFYYLVNICVCSYFLYKKRTHAEGIIRNQLNIIFWGLTATIAVAFFTNLVYPTITGSSRLSFLGPITTLFFLSASLYAILRYRFLDIHIIIRRSLIFFLLAAAVLGVYAFLAIAVQRMVTGQAAAFGWREASLVLFVGITAVPLYHFFERVTDRFFFRSRYNTQQTILDIGKKISSVVSLEELESKLVDALTTTMRMKAAAMLRSDGNGSSGYRVALSRGFPKLQVAQEVDATIFQYFFKNSDAFITEEVARIDADALKADRARHKLYQFLVQHELTGMVPLFSKHQLVGVFVLGEKKSGDAYTNEDIKLLEILSHSAAVATENAMLYRNLENRIEQRTAEVNEKNKYLLTLQRVTGQIIQTVDFRELNQKLVDAVHKEMGYLGAMILDYDQLTNGLRFAAVTRSPEINAAIEKSGLFLEAVQGSTDGNAMVRKCLEKRELLRTEKLSEILKPAIPGRTAGNIQRMLGLKSVLALPVEFNDKVYGLLVFLLDKPLSEVRDAEVEVVRSLVQMAAIVSKNSQYYQEIQNSNKKLQNAYKMINEQLGQLEEANRHLQQLDKAKTEFLSIASHQLRTPLSAIRGYISLLEEGDFGQLDDTQVKVLGKAQENVKRLISLVNDLLSLARIEAGTGPKGLRLEEIDFREVIDQVVEEVALKAKQKGLELIWERPDEPILITLDREKIEQVVMNLVDNAVHYTPEGSVAVKPRWQGETLHIEFTDTGIGVDPDGLREMFTKFFRSANAVKVRPDGTGIGLYVAKMMVESHGGKIWVQSELGKGTTFFVELPAKQENSSEEGSPK